MKKADKCEICGLQEKSALHSHHIIPRCDERSTNTPENLVSVCASCHQLIHRSEIIVEGWFLTSSGMKFFWRRKEDKPIIRIGIIFKSDGKVDIL